MSIDVVGTDAISDDFGGVLAHAREDVVFITRGANLRAIRKHGLQIDVRDKFVVNLARATDDPSSAVLVDTILVTVKAWQIEGWFKTRRPWPIGNLRDITTVLPSGSWKSVRLCGWAERPTWPSQSMSSFTYASLVPAERRARGEIVFAQPENDVSKAA
jgi:hypothetical protein